jgi:hypothetical protein
MAQPEMAQPCRDEAIRIKAGRAGFFTRKVFEVFGKNLICPPDGKIRFFKVFEKMRKIGSVGPITSWVAWVLLIMDDEIIDLLREEAYPDEDIDGSGSAMPDVLAPASATAARASASGGNNDASTKKRGGRTSSPVWSLFTDHPNPQSERCVPCKNCKKSVFHYKKCEYAKRHLLKCQPFRSLMMSMDANERPDWFTTKRSRSAVSQSATSQRSICDYAVPSIDRKTKAKFQELIALHYYLTGTSFQRIEDPNLAKAIQLLRPDADLLPTRRMLAERLLDKNYDKIKSMSTSCLSDKANCFCLATDGWSNVRNEPIINYIAISPNKSLFLESVSTGEQGHNANFIAGDILRIMQKFPDTKFSGVITDNTSANRNAWAQLKEKLPALFFQGCMSHGLHLLVKDIFAATKTRRQSTCNVTAYPPGYPFEHLLNFANDVKDVVKFFHNHHVIKAALTKMQKSAGVISLVRPAPTRFDLFHSSVRVSNNVMFTVYQVGNPPAVLSIDCRFRGHSAQACE